MRIQTLAIAFLFAAGCVTTAYNPNQVGGGGSGGSGGGGSGGSGGGGSGGTGGGGGSGGTGGAGGGGSGGSGGGMGKSGTISADETWSGTTSVSGDVTIAKGVTVTIADGAIVKVATGHGISVAGTLKIVGTATGGVKLGPDPAPGSWTGLSVASGGSVDIAYAELDQPTTGLAAATGAASVKADHLSVLNYSGPGVTMATAGAFTWLKLENMAGGGDGIVVNAGANDTVTVTDSTFHNTGGDAVVCDAGNLTIRYSHVYAATPGGHSGIHCAQHYSTTGVVLADHNLFENANWALMASGMSASSKINLNNFTGFIAGADAGLWSSAGAGMITAGVDLTNNYWDGAASGPSGTGTSLVTTTYNTKGNMVANVGPGATRP